MGQDVTPEEIVQRANAAQAAGRWQEAEQLIRRAVELRPEVAEYHFQLAQILRNRGRWRQAVDSYQRAVELCPDFAEALSILAQVLSGIGRLDEAIAAASRAVALRPDLAETQCNLGKLLNDARQWDRAIAFCRAAIQIKPESAEPHNNLGNALSGVGELEEAVAAYRRAIELSPDEPSFHNNLGIVLHRLKRLDEAAAAFRRAIALRPDFAAAHFELGAALRDKFQFDEAIACYRRAIQLCPDDAWAHNSLANALGAVGQREESIASSRRAIALFPDKPGIHGNLLFRLLYDPASDAASVLAEHRAWADRHARPLASRIAPHPNDRAPDRLLRVGYVSADFRRHSIAHFFLPLLQHHDRAGFKTFCYANNLRSDDVSERMKRHCDVWRDIVGMSDAAAADLVRSDAIDILVDLSGHTDGNRLLILARKPAPVQVTYLGYPNSTGMTAVDYRITDALADPPGLTDWMNIETLWRLPGCAWCYQPLDDAPDIEPRGDGPITFGCFNVFRKINFGLVELWADLLQRVSSSRLLLKSAGAGEASSQQRLREQFARHGIPADRIEMVGRIPDPRRHLEFYGRVDIALDTYPYHGTTTTCEALWMGVPVVSIEGRTHASRVGVSLLNHAGLPELVARDRAQYVDIASGLAANRTRLAEWRRTLRARMSASPLMDGKRLAGDIESAYRQMWRTWCSKS
jgi:protein O-GlcNAc transferase